MSLKVSSATEWLVDRGFVVGTVTAAEVYFRDMLDAIFRTCKPEAFRAKLRDIHKKKYDIDDILAIYVRSVHPCELILEDISFQRIETIDNVFSAIIGAPFWKSCAPITIRIKDEIDPAKWLTVPTDSFGKFGRLVQLRHELIHNPDTRKHALTEDEVDCLSETPRFIMACDLRLTRFIAENLDPEIERLRVQDADAPGTSRVARDKEGK